MEFARKLRVKLIYIHWYTNGDPRHGITKENLNELIKIEKHKKLYWNVRNRFYDQIFLNYP